MLIKIISVGKMKSKELSILADDYKNRINRYLKISEIVLKEGRNNPKNRSVLKNEEGAAILRSLDVSDFFIPLDEKGDEMTTLEFTKLLEFVINSGKKSLCFAIGGAYGLSNDVKTRADKSLSLSKMTLTHEMANVLLLEQIYRSFTIMKGEPYHNI